MTSAVYCRKNGVRGIIEIAKRTSFYGGNCAGDIMNSAGIVCESCKFPNNRIEVSFAG
jgi:hypothetical protein